MESRPVLGFAVPVLVFEKMDKMWVQWQLAHAEMDDFEAQACALTQKKPLGMS